MTTSLVVLNVGSSSVKYSLFVVRDDQLELEQRGKLVGLDAAPRFVAKDAHGEVVRERDWPDGERLVHDGAIAWLLDHVRAESARHRLIGVGHRVVHGGMTYAEPMRVDAEALASLERLVPFAPLHQPHNLAPIRLLLESAPELPQVACFDTAFHRTNSELSQMYALPHALHVGGVRRYGFHGLSYESIVSLLPRFDESAARGRCIVLHLGAGASMCAIRDGKSIASTMGFSTAEGLPMGTRSGTLDPGVILYLMDQRGMDARAVERLVYGESGLLGVSGVSGDMRTLLASAEPRARLAVDLLVYRIRREMGSLVAALGGVDAIVFTGGVGENAPAIRADVCGDAAWLGLELDADANANGDARISTQSSHVRAWTIPTDEERVIARHTWRLVATS